MWSTLFRAFADIALWRRGPQDLPASRTLVWLVAALYALASGVQIGMMGWNVPSVVLLLLFDLALQAAWLWGLLTFFAYRARFLQTMAAFIGVGTLLAMLDIVVTLVSGLFGVTDETPGNPWPWLHLALLLLMLGRILQQALERSLFMGMMLTFVIMLTISLLARGLVPGM